MYGYESMNVIYKVDHRYTPDFVLPNGILVEVKGYFTSEDRGKLLKVKKQHPHLDIRLLFGNAKNKLSKKSKTTYAMWCDKHGFPWAEKKLPDSWLVDKPQGGMHQEVDNDG